MFEAISECEYLRKIRVLSVFDLEISLLILLHQHQRQAVNRDAHSQVRV